MNEAIESHPCMWCGKESDHKCGPGDSCGNCCANWGLSLHDGYGDRVHKWLRSVAQYHVAALASAIEEIAELRVQLSVARTINSTRVYRESHVESERDAAIERAEVGERERDEYLIAFKLAIVHGKDYAAADAATLYEIAKEQIVAERKGKG